jgi:RNA polymerase sigma factor (sigma-70 family)
MYWGPALTAPIEALLSKVVVLPRRDDAASFRRLIEDNEDLVELIARIVRRTHTQVSLEDFEGAGRIGLVQAAKRWRPDGGLNFRSFAGRRMKGEMLELVRRRHQWENSSQPLPSSETRDPQAGRSIELVDTRKRVVSILKELPEPERQALTLHYIDEKPRAEVAKRMGRSHADLSALIASSLSHAREVEEPKAA